MIPDYKLYHGAVLAELVDRMTAPVSVDEFVEQGRLRSYVLDGRIGLLIKHSLQRLTPWQFTFTGEHIRELDELQEMYPDSFVVLVCKQDGMVCLTVEEVRSLFPLGAEQASIRVSRHRRELYAVSSGMADLPRKCADGVQIIVDKLAVPVHASHRNEPAFSPRMELPVQALATNLEAQASLVNDKTVSVRMRFASVLSRLGLGMGR